MILDQTVTVQAPIEQVWAFVMDMDAVAKCVPGVESVEERTEDEYVGALKVRVGPVTVRLEGTLRVVERNHSEYRAQVSVEAVDHRIRGAMNAKTMMQLHSLDASQTELTVHTDAAVLGKLGEFGQTIIRRKADQIMKEFARGMSRKIDRTS